MAEKSFNLTSSFRGSPESVRSVNPSTWPQYPYDSEPFTPEKSEPRYLIQNDWNHTFTLRDGTRLLLDVYRPAAAGQKFPALCCFSPYSRQLQRELAPYGQNEAGIIEFWVPRGYAQVVVDVRGANGSQGVWDFCGPTEQRDMVEVIEWVAQQSWCNGKVGMTGCSYFGRTQLLAAGLRAPSLKAIFPYDANTDMYRHAFMPGGIPNDGFARSWFAAVETISFASGRGIDRSGIRRFSEALIGVRYPFDGPFYRERSAGPTLHNIRIPTYFGCHWSFINLHLPGAFEGWHAAGASTKRMLIGPDPSPSRPFAAYHQEALRWYDAFLKGLDTRVLEGAPIHLWIRGEETWRDEMEWPLARTRFTEYYLGGSVENGTMSDSPPSDGAQTLSYNPAGDDWTWGRPRWTYRSEAVGAPLEITGPIELDLTIASSAEDTDWIAILYDEAPDFSVRELTRGWLRSSHRATDPSRSKPAVPYHPHDRALPLVRGREEQLQIGLVPSCNVFQKGHRIRLEIANCDSLAENSHWYKRTLLIPADNTVVQGRGRSKLILPIVPR